MIDAKKKDVLIRDSNKERCVMLSLTPRERVLNLFAGKEVDRPACYSGMGNVTTAALEEMGCKFQELHGDAAKMARAGASSYRLFGYESAVIPFDLCVEAEALGCAMNPYDEVEQLLYPTIKEKIIHSEEEITTFPIPADLLERGRINVICEAIRLLKQDVGQEVAVGTYLLGPFTLAGQLMDLNDLFKLTFKKPDKVNAMLDRLADVQIGIGKKFYEAGADYISVREMGATTDVLSPKTFDKVIAPHLKKIFAGLPGNNILHICGGTNSVIKIMNECGAGALSIEFKNDMVKTRTEIGSGPLVFGQVDAYNVLVTGKSDDVVKGVLASLDAGVDAVWPGCDIWPTAPLENLRAMVETVKEHGANRWARKKG
ncbi:uroporphyrinogen decarboxylase [Peptococcaceae bacterium CEB3]|nr:uroporphyrinogen decarboxylase [Peptococcaceae bacterium CEB3]